MSAVLLPPRTPFIQHSRQVSMRKRNNEGILQQFGCAPQCTNYCFPDCTELLGVSLHDWVCSSQVGSCRMGMFVLKSRRHQLLLQALALCEQVSLIGDGCVTVV